MSYLRKTSSSSNLMSPFSTFGSWWNGPVSLCFYCLILVLYSNILMYFADFCLEDQVLLALFSVQVSQGDTKQEGRAAMQRHLERGQISKVDNCEHSQIQFMSIQWFIPKLPEKRPNLAQPVCWCSLEHEIILSYWSGEWLWTGHTKLNSSHLCKHCIVRVLLQNCGHTDWTRREV